MGASHAPIILPMRIKRADTVVLEPTGSGFHCFNYATGSEFECDGKVVSLIADLGEWTDAKRTRELMRRSIGTDDEDVLVQLVAAGALVEDGSDSADREKEFNDRWRWSTPSAILHRATTGRPVGALADQVAMQREKVRREPSPALGYQPPCDAEVIRCPDPNLASGLYARLAQRRTVREGQDYTLEFTVLADLLFSGFGVTDWTDGSVGRLPLKFAPSGGARNPFDAFLYVRDVEGLEPGPYRYSGLDHCIVPLESAHEASIVGLMGGQDWAANAACLILLVADFSRSMWKYEGDDNAYRVVMIEAGHIGQNIMLMAAEHRLSACASAALDHDLADATFGLRRVDQSAVYALAINKPPMLHG